MENNKTENHLVGLLWIAGIILILVGIFRKDWYDIAGGVALIWCLTK